jgi:predicted ATPase
MVGVVGEPDMGKSRLLAELAERIRSNANVHWGRCLSYGEGITYWPVTELLKSAAGILQSDARDQIAEKLDQLLARLRTEDPDELRTLAAAVSNVLGIPTTPRGTYAAAEIAQGELHWGIRRAAQLLALEQPTVLVVEDLHWAEQTLVELIEFIATADSEVPLLIVWTARPELLETQPEFGNGPGRDRIELDVLPARAGTELLAARSRHFLSPPSLLRPSDDV